jgi:hypothetical protein
MSFLSALNPMLVLEDKDKSTLKLTNEVLTETKRLDEFVCGSILHELTPDQREQIMTQIQSLVCQLDISLKITQLPWKSEGKSLVLL